MDSCGFHALTFNYPDLLFYQPIKLVDRESIYRSTASLWRWRAVLPLGVQAACEPSVRLIPDKPEQDWAG